MKKSSKSHEKVDRMDKIQQEQEVNETTGIMSKSIDWPLGYCIHSMVHLRRFYPVESIPSSFEQRLQIDVPEETRNAFDDLLVRAFLSGIGVYESLQMTENQRRMVMRLLPKLAFLWSGQDIVFGTNVEGLTNLFLHNSFASIHSRNVLYQLIGRVGRIGMSYEANIVMDSEATLLKIMSFYDSVDPTSVSFEAFLSNDESS